jgi:hypothetical protein
MNLLIVVEPVVILIRHVQSELFLLANDVLRETAQKFNGDNPFDFLSIKVENVSLRDHKNSFLSPFTLVDLADFITENDLLSVEVGKHFLILV